MTDLTHKIIDAMPASRPMDRLIHQHVLGKSLENYCVRSLRPAEGQCEGCELPCPLPRYSTDWGAMREVVDALPFFRLCRWVDDVWQCLAGTCGNILDHVLSSDGKPACGCRYAYGQDAPDAVGRAALKWAVGKNMERRETCREAQTY